MAAPEPVLMRHSPSVVASPRVDWLHVLQCQAHGKSWLRGWEDGSVIKSQQACGPKFGNKVPM